MKLSIYNVAHACADEVGALGAAGASGTEPSVAVWAMLARSPAQVFAFAISLTILSWHATECPTGGGLQQKHRIPRLPSAGPSACSSSETQMLSLPTHVSRKDPRTHCSRPTDQIPG